MQITVNGESTTIEGPCSLAELVDRLEFAGRRVAIERNGEIVPRSEHADCRIAEGDRIEIVHAIGGGRGR